MAGEQNQSEQQKQQELNQARNEKSRYESSLSDKQKLYNENNAKIKRLQAVKKRVEESKSTANGRCKELAKFAEGEEAFSDWYGNMCNKTKESFSTVINPKYTSYVNDIDDVLDAICDEITRLQNQNYTLDSDIGWLKSAINSLINKIRTLCN